MTPARETRVWVPLMPVTPQIEAVGPVSLVVRADPDATAVDETGGQMAVFGRVGSRPFTRPEMEKLFLNSKGLVYKVSDTVDQAAWRPPLAYPN